MDLGSREQYRHTGSDRSGVLFPKIYQSQSTLDWPSEIAADDEFQLFVNGKKIGSGKSSRELQQFDISEQLEVGRNVVAVKVLNTHGSTAALAARVSVKPEKQPKWFTFSSDASWKVSSQESPRGESVVLQ